MQRIRQQLETRLPATDQTLDQIEDIAEQVGQKVSQKIEKHLVHQQTKRTRPKHQACSCGHLARYKGQQSRQVVTTHGVLLSRRGVYYCACCQHSFAPTDTRLGLGNGSTTTQVRHWAATLSGLLPFAQAATSLELLTGVRLSAATLERIAVG